MRNLKRKKSNMISKIIFILYLVLSIITIGIILYLNILPIKILTFFLCLHILLTFIFKITLFSKKNKAINKIFNFLCIVFIILFIMALIYLAKTLNFMDLISFKEYQVENYYILTLKDSKYEKLSDLNNLDIGFYDNSENYIKAKEELNRKINFNELKYDTYVEAIDSLLNNKSTAIFISSIYKSILDEQIEDLENKVKIIETISIKIKSDVEITDIDVTKQPFSIYISGIDIYGDISLVSRSDVNMIATVNPLNHQILLTSIPRDYYVKLHGTNGYRDKLTHAGIYGINMSITTIEDLFDIDLDYYIRVNFTTLINLVDSIGGIDIYSDTVFTAHTNNLCTYIKGNNHLDGACALAFSRERYAYKEGDRHRVQNQQAVLTAILTKIASSKTLITKYMNILETLGKSFQTNMPKENIYSLINMQLDKMPKWNITSISVNGKDSYNYTYSYSAGKLYVMEPDMNTVAIATNKIKEVIGS